MRPAGLRGRRIKNVNRHERLERRIGRAKIRRSYSDDGVILGRNGDAPADDRRVAPEKSLPELICENDHSRSAKPIGLCGEGLTENGACAEDLKEIARGES